jgi:hypothetical protein
MSELESPFVVSDGGDLMAFNRLEDVESQIEVYDVGAYEFFDASGQRLVATLDGYRVHLHAARGAAPEPERLEALLRSYFAGLAARRQRFAAYGSAADRAASLHELLELRLELSNEARGFWSRLRRKSRGRGDVSSA